VVARKKPARGRGDAAAAGAEIRCAGCGSLLAKLQGPTLNLQRGDLQASFDGQFHASIVCYRARCRQLTVVHVGGGDG
jgi:hypothetical protein